MPLQTNKEAKDKTEPSQPAPTQAPAISVPKGDGAIKGIDEKFSVNPATATASLSVSRRGGVDFDKLVLLGLVGAVKGGRIGLPCLRGGDDVAGMRFGGVMQ